MNEEPPDVLEEETDGDVHVWRNWCYVCHEKSLEIIKPGVVRCKICGD